MRARLIAAAIAAALLLGGCARSEEYEAQLAFERAFGERAAAGVEAVHGYYYSHREWLVATACCFRWPDTSP